MTDLDLYLEHKRTLVNQTLENILPPPGCKPQRLHSAMRYAVFAGGKRIRPICCLASAEAVGGSDNDALSSAAAIELLHTYSLIHDDLPAMDDDVMRRGKPTCHIEYGEANAILAGDALLTLAFEVLANSHAKAPYTTAHTIQELAQAAGHNGLIAGQVEDLASEGKEPLEENVTYIHYHKTAILFRASMRIGAMAGGGTEPHLEALSVYGEEIGIAFQITDDLLNATSSAAALGKSAGSDKQRDKTTYVSVFGIEGSKTEAKASVDRAVSALTCLPGNTAPLVELAQFILDRTT